MSRINWWFFAGTYSIGAASGLVVGHTMALPPAEVGIVAAVLVATYLFSVIQWSRRGRATSNPGGDT